MSDIDIKHRGANLHATGAGRSTPKDVDSPLAVEETLAADPNYRNEIHTATDIVDIEIYCGGLDLTRRTTTPRLQISRDKWFNLMWLIPLGFALVGSHDGGPTKGCITCWQCNHSSSSTLGSAFILASTRACPPGSDGLTCSTSS